MPTWRAPVALGTPPHPGPFGNLALRWVPESQDTYVSALQSAAVVARFAQADTAAEKGDGEAALGHFTGAVLLAAATPGMVRTSAR